MASIISPKRRHSMISSETLNAVEEIAKQLKASIEEEKKGLDDKENKLGSAAGFVNIARNFAGLAGRSRSYGETFYDLFYYYDLGTLEDSIERISNNFKNDKYKKIYDLKIQKINKVLELIGRIRDLDL